VKRFILPLVAVAAAAFVLFRPAPAPAPAPAVAGWSAAPPAAGERDARAHGTPAPRALAYVAGEVVRPGVYPVGADARVRDAVTLAGGTRPNADLTAINLAAHVRDGDAVVVPARGEAAPLAGSTGARARTRGPRRSRSHRAASRGSAGGVSSRGTSSRRHRRGSGDVPPAAEVDINSADAQTLATIPGIGDGLAERIVEFRRVNGPFASVDELLDVAGITEHRLDAIIPYVVAR
jgi:competence protein ComEA